MKGRGRGREGRKERGRKEENHREWVSKQEWGLEWTQSWGLILCLLLWQPQFSHLWYCKTNVKIRQSTKKCLMYCTVSKKKKGISLAFWVLPASSPVELMVSLQETCVELRCFRCGQTTIWDIFQGNVCLFLPVVTYTFGLSSFYTRHPEKLSKK